MRFIQVILLAIAALVSALAPACAEKRVALVIGNNSYANLPASEQLLKAVNDAHAVGAALTSIGFEVMSGDNLGRAALVDKFDAFTERLEAGDTAFFFYSGHGVSLGGVNYILPSDIPNIAENQESRLAHAAFSEQDIVADLRGRGVRVAVVVLDACRNNPFARPGGKGVGFSKGLSAPPQVSGVFSLYAAAAGQGALDRLSDDDRNPNSVFSRVLLPVLTRPGVDLTALAFDVREEVARVAKEAGFVQEPAYYDGTIGGRVYLAGLPPAGGQTAVTPPPVTPPPVNALAAEAAQMWEAVKNTTDIAVVDGFEKRYGTVPIYGDLGRAKHAELQKLALLAPPPRRDGEPLTPDQARGLKKGDTFRECANCPEMVVMPTGSFTMGSPASEKDRSGDEGPQRTVRISSPFAMGKFHVTRDEFAAFANDTGFSAHQGCDWRNPGFSQDGSHPVVCVTWDDANAYANWLSRKTGRTYRLPSEAEFEYAARAGTTTPFWWGSSITPDQANYDGRSVYTGGGSKGAYRQGTVPDSSFRPNPWGIYNVHGNAYQWMTDCYHDDYTGAPSDGSAWTSGSCSARVVLGGSWGNNPQILRAAYRNSRIPGSHFNYVGFRLARTLSP